MTHDAQLPGTFPGHRYWKAIQGAVDAILAPMGIKRKVVSRGSQFVNVDAWTWLAFNEHLCAHLAEHPDRAPAKAELKQILRRANAVKCTHPHIRVAKMPARVNHRTALAIIGGGYHEAWHTKYSKRDRVRLSEVQEIVDLVDEFTREGGKFDAKLRGLLTTLQHLIEDIRIERRGNEDFPGAIQPMRDLQDFILDLEAKGRARAEKVKNITVTSNARSILLCALRDLGLGYNTQKAREALAFYKETAPGAVAMLAPGGLLAPLLHEATVLPADDKTGSLRVAMKIVVALWRASQGAEEEDDDDQGFTCPQCGTGPENLVIRAVRDDEGRKLAGVAEMECKECGFKHVFKLPDQSLDFSQDDEEPDEDAPRPEVEDLSLEDVDGSDGYGYDDREKARDHSLKGDGAPQDGSPQAGDEDGLDENVVPVGRSVDPDEPEDEGSPSEGVLPLGGAAGEGEEDDDGDGDGHALLTGRGPNMPPEGGEDEADQTDGEMTGRELLEKLLALGAGGVNLDLGRDPDSVFDEVEEILKGGDSDGYVDGIKALQEQMHQQALAQVRTLEYGEMVWNPYNPMLDEARFVRSSNEKADLHRANAMLDEVRGTVTYFRSRLRMIVRAQEMTDTTHGVRRGRKMSSRMLVDTAVDLKSGRMPTRAFEAQDVQIDTSFAMALCLDQSSSMWSRVREVSQCMLLLGESVEGIGGKTMAFGFRNGEDGDYAGDEEYTTEWHRVCGVRYDVFKAWEEKFVNSKWRFAHTQATGTTPMADGIQYGLSSLNERTEAHRVLGVLTDGQPDLPHERVIRRQLRLAKAAGIQVIGIGIGNGASYVKNLFDDSVWVPKVQELPQPLLKKLNELCDFTGRYRGRKARLDGNITRKVS